MSIKRFETTRRAARAARDEGLAEAHRWARARSVARRRRFIRRLVEKAPPYIRLVTELVIAGIRLAIAASLL